MIFCKFPFLLVILYSRDKQVMNDLRCINDVFYKSIIIVKLFLSKKTHNTDINGIFIKDEIM